MNEWFKNAIGLCSDTDSTIYYNSDKIIKIVRDSKNKITVHMTDTTSLREFDARKQLPKCASNASIIEEKCSKWFKYETSIQSLGESTTYINPKFVKLIEKKINHLIITLDSGDEITY
jgi:hypothetical protein